MKLNNYLTENDRFVYFLWEYLSCIEVSAETGILFIVRTVISRPKNQLNLIGEVILHKADELIEGSHR